MQKNIYELRMHEKTMLSHKIEIMRVPSGWIYFYKNEKGTEMCFVPFTKEIK